MPVDKPANIGRRSFLRRTARAAAALAVLGTGSAIAILRTTGYQVDPARAARLRALSGWQLAVVDALLARLLAPDVPWGTEGAPPTPAEVGAAEFIDAYMAEADPPTRRDLRALLTLLEHGYPLMCGERHRFTALDGGAQDRVLQAMERSHLDAMRGCFGAIKSLAMMAYYRDPRTWGVLGYDGPLERRPEGGWTPLRFVPPDRRGA